MRSDFAHGYRPTVAEACEAFIACEMPARNYRAATRKSYTYAIQAYVREAHDCTYADQLDLASVQCHQHELERQGESGSARHVKLAAIKAFITYLEEQNLLPRPFSRAIHLAAGDETEPRGVAEETAAALLAAAGRHARDHAILTLLLHTGIGLGELIALRLDDLTLPAERRGGIRRTASLRSYSTSTSNRQAREEWTGGYLRVRGRSDQSREILLDDAACQAFAAYLGRRPISSHPQIFLTRNATPLTIQGAHLLVKKYARLAGVTWAHARALRATYITQQLARGTSLSEVQYRVGHGSRSTTRRYAELFGRTEPIGGAAPAAPTKQSPAASSAAYQTPRNQEGSGDQPGGAVFIMQTDAQREFLRLGQTIGRRCAVLIVGVDTPGAASLRRILRDAGYDVYEAPESA